MSTAFPRRLQERLRYEGDPLYWVLKFGCVITVALILLFFYLCISIPLSFEPSCSIQNFYVPALNKFINTTIGISSTDTLIFFDLELRNAMDNKGVHYDAVNLTFSYGTNTSMAIGTYSVPGFYQGKGKKAQRRDVAMVTGSVPWVEAAMMALSSGSTAGFRVGLVTKVKFNNYLWYSKKKRIVVGGMVEVDDSGRKVEKKPVKLVVASLLVSLFLLK